MSTVFISYRRASTLVHARAVYERLSRELGPGQVFIDLDDMEPGVDFIEQTNQQLNGCRVLLALIEPDWAAARDAKGQRRLDRSNDFVRIEIATALRRGIRVVPILIGDAEMPDEDALPDDLKPLVRRQALALDFKRFDPEVARVLAAIRRILASPAEAGPAQKAPVPPPPAEPVEAQPPAASPPPSPQASVPRPPPPATPQPLPRPAPEPPPAAAMPEAAAVSPPSANPRSWPRFAAAGAGVALLSTLFLLPGTKSDVPGFRDCPECPEMVVIPAGSFMMGSPADEPGRQDDEGPQRRVTVASFAMGRTEVTQGQWKALMGDNPSNFSQCGDDCPVENVSWDDAQKFIQRLNEKTGKRYSLPSEAQWEYAARAGTTTAYHTGAAITKQQANFESEKARRVGSFAANAFGLHDMHGNVREWVQDCYDKQAYAGKAPNNGGAYVPADCASRVLRGGSWLFDSNFLRSSGRLAGLSPDVRSTDFGFRVCRVSPIE